MNTHAPFTLLLPDEHATLQLGASWANSITAPLVVYLEGDLGAGKTTFTRGLLRGLGYQGTVKSPTYAIVESYPLARFTLNHFDLYRFTAPEEWEDAGLGDLVNNKSICLLEWANKGETFTPPADVTLYFVHTAEGRKLTLQTHTEYGKKSLEAWKRDLPAVK